jgi:hypothetical protein
VSSEIAARAARIGLIAAVVTGTAWWLRRAPELTPEVAPPCLSRSLLGIECPGCGTARALHALLHGHLAESFWFNPALWVGSGLIVLALGLNLWPVSRRWLAERPWVIRYTAWGTLAALATWTVARNLWPIDNA